MKSCVTNQNGNILVGLITIKGKSMSFIQSLLKSKESCCWYQWPCTDKTRVAFGSVHIRTLKTRIAQTHKVLIQVSTTNHRIFYWFVAPSFSRIAHFPIHNPLLATVQSFLFTSLFPFTSVPHTSDLLCRNTSTNVPYHGLVLYLMKASIPVKSCLLRNRKIWSIVPTHRRTR